MKNSFFKFTLTIFLIVSLLSLTACGGGGGGGGNSGDNGNGSFTPAVQQALVHNAMTSIKSVIGNLFNSNLRANTAIRAYVEVLEELDEYATGAGLLYLCKLIDKKEMEYSGNYMHEQKSKLLTKFSEKFPNATTKTISNGNMAVAINGEFKVFLSHQATGKNTTTILMASKVSGTVAVGACYMFDGGNYSTFMFKCNSNFTDYSGCTFKYDQYGVKYNDSSDSFSIASIEHEENSTNYHYIDTKTGDTRIFKSDGTDITNESGTDTPLADEGRFGEVKGVRFALKPLVENIDRLINLTTTSSARADIIIPDSLSKYNTGKELKKIIPSTTIDEFMSNSGIANKTKVLDKKPITNDKDIPDGKGTISMAVGRHTESGLNVGISIAEAKITVENQAINYKVTVRFVAEPNGDAVVAIGTLDGGASNFISAILFRTNKDASEIVGKTFGKNMHDTLETCDAYSFDSTNNLTSTITGNATQFTYTHTDGGTRVIKYDGTIVE